MVTMVTIHNRSPINIIEGLKKLSDTTHMVFTGLSQKAVFFKIKFIENTY